MWDKNYNVESYNGTDGCARSILEVGPWARQTQDAKTKSNQSKKEKKEKFGGQFQL